MNPSIEPLEARCLLSYGTALPLEAGSRPSAVAAADFNGDGRADLVVANQTRPGGVCVLLGNADGTFQPAREYAAGDDTSGLATVDLNGDGRLDLAVAEPIAGTVGVRYGLGDGTFGPALRFLAGPRASALSFGDFNGDGRTDLAAVNDGGVGGLPGQSGVSVLLNNGDGTFAPRTPVGVALSPLSLAVGDFDEDGKADLAAAAAHLDRVTLLLGNGDGTFRLGRVSATGGAPTSTTAADLNDDGHLDVVVANEFGVDATVLLGNGDGTFDAAQTYTPDPGSGYHEVIVTDVDRDGYGDLALSGCPGFVLVLYGDGAGRFPTFARVAAGIDAMTMTAGDFNGDGQLDFVTASPTDDEAVLLLTRTATETTFVASRTEAVPGQEVTFWATVRTAGARVPTGKVQFVDGATVLATVDLVDGAASHTTAALTPGSHQVVVRFCGDRNFEDSTSAAAGVSVSIPPEPPPPPPPPIEVPVVVVPPVTTVSLNERFVGQLYAELLGRPVDPTGRVAWTRALDTGTSPTAVAGASAASQ
jgi:large repetitive protein